MTLPAHRYEDRKKGKGKRRVWTFDYDGTITGAPERLARIAQGLKDQGDKIVVLTGNQMARKDLLQALDDYKFPYDEVVQYEDNDSNGVARAEYLKQFGTWGGFDNRVDRAVLFAPICPHLYLVVEPTKQDKKDAQHADAKQDAKKVAKKVGLRAEQRGAPRVPPKYRPKNTVLPGARVLPMGSCCGTCDMNNAGLCWGYGNVRIEDDYVCDSFYPEETTSAD